MNRLLLLLALVAGSGCASSAPARSTFELAAADLVPQLAHRDIAIAMARPVDVETPTRHTWSSTSLKNRARSLEQYPDKLLAAFVRAKNEQRATLGGTDPKLRLLTREHLVLLLEEQGLQWSDLMPTNPKTRVRLKAITAVQAYVVWKIELRRTHMSSDHPLNRYYENWTLMVISVQTGEIIAASKTHRRYLT